LLILDTCFRRYDEHENCTVFSFLAGLLAMTPVSDGAEALLPSVLALVWLALRCGKQETGNQYISVPTGKTTGQETTLHKGLFFPGQAVLESSA
jgi:hypothetical protein